VADALVNIGPEAIPELKEALNNSTKEIIGAIRNIIQRIEKAQEQKKGTPATEPKRSSALETGPGMAAQPVDEASQILWDVATGAISKENAKARLSEALPVLDVPHHQRDAAYDALIAQASVVTAALGVRRNSRYASPSRDEILAVATKIKEAGIEVFVPKSQFPGDTAGKYRRAIEAVGGKLRAYQKIEDLQNLVKNPAKSIVMTSGMTGDDLALVEALKAGNSKLRFMSFEKVEELESMGVDELDNYQADILGILLVARVITPEDCLDQGNPTYRLLLHLLEDYMPDGVSVENYVNDIVTNASRFIKTILKALPITAYKTMRQSMEVLWSA
jgi:hypothetical protein